MTPTIKHYNENEINTTLLNYSPDPVFILDTEGRCLDMNSAACSILGYSRSELLAMSVRDLIPADDKYSIPQEFLKLNEAGILTALIHLINNKGGLIPVKLNAVKIPDGNYIAFCNDISEFRQAEDMLMKSRQQLNIITDNIPALVTCVCARDMVYRFVNRTFADTFGMTRELFIGKPVREVIGDEAFKRAEPYIKQALSGERVTYENRIPVQGTYRWFKIDYMPETEESGTVKNIIVLMLDITEQKNKDEELQESENRFRMLFDQSPDLNLIVTREGMVADINEACLEVTGYRRDEVIGQKYIKLPWTIRKTIPQILSMYNEALKGYVIREQELVLQHKNGMTLYFELFVNPIVVEGEIKIFQTILRNITKRKQAEEELGLSEDKFRFIVEHSMMPMIIATLKDYTVIFYNNYATDFFIDTSVEGTIRASDYWVNPEERDGFIAILREKGSVHSYEAELKTRFGEHKWCLLSAKIINYLGQPSSFVMVNDITELKRTQEEREKLIVDIRNALSKVKQLSGMLPICASCKNIRNDKGYWEQIESYIKDHSEAEFSHGLCPICAKKLYPGIYKGE